MKLWVYPLAGIVILVICLPYIVLAGPRQARRPVPALAFMDVRLDAPVKLSRLKPGDTLHGKIIRNVFSGYHLMVPRGSRIYLTVSGMKRGPRVHNSMWPWPAQYFRPKYEKLPNFDFADVTMPDGKGMRFQVSDVCALDTTHVAADVESRRHSGTKTRTSSNRSKQAGEAGRVSGPSLELVVRAKVPEANGSSAAIEESHAYDPAFLAGIETLSAGSKANLALLGPLSASKSQTGDQFKALLVQPVRLNSGEILPEGTVFEGRVTKSVPPRWLSRPGSLYVTFTRLILPAEADLPIAASVAGVDVSQRSRLKLNSEGGMSGGSPGKARLLLDLGVSAGLSKVADDTYQLIAEAVVSTATDASTAGTARLIGFAVTGLYMLTRHGLDVTLPRYTRVTIRFDRPPSPEQLEGTNEQESLR